MFDGEHGIALHAMQGIGPHLVVREKSHGFSLVAVGTWGIFLTYNGDGASKLVVEKYTSNSSSSTPDK